MHYLPDEKLRHSHIPGYGCDLLAGIIANHGLLLINKFRNFFLIRVKLLNYCTFIITSGHSTFFKSSALSSDWCPLWNLCIGTSRMNAKQYSMPFPNFWGSEIASWCCFPHRQCPIESSLLYRQNWKQVKYVHEINNLKCLQFTNHTLYIYLY